MIEGIASRISAELESRGINATVEDWAGGFAGLSIDTPFVTPDGSMCIRMWVGSDDDGRVLVQYGDCHYGQYSDNSIETGIAETEASAVAGWVADTLADLGGSGRLPEDFDHGLADAYPDIAAG